MVPVAVAHRKGVRFPTAAHVVRSETPLEEVAILVDGNEWSAKVESVHAALDTAILSVPSFKGKGLPLAESGPKGGDRVFVFGYPVKYAGTALPKIIGTSGEVVQSDYRYDKIDHPVLQVRGGSHFGGSGGAIVDEGGKLLGLVFAARFNQGETTHVYGIPVSALMDPLGK